MAYKTCPVYLRTHTCGPLCRLPHLRTVGITLMSLTVVYGRLSQLVAAGGLAAGKKRWFIAEETMFQSAPKVILRTELEHEMGKFWERMSQLFIQVVVVVALHLYLGSAEAVLIQGGMNVSG